MDFNKFKSHKEVKTVIRKHREKAPGIILGAFFDKSKTDYPFYVKKDGIEYPIVLKHEDLVKVKYVFSSIDNDAHSLWTLIEFKDAWDTTNLDITFKYWKPIRPSMKIRGELKDGYFYINYDWLNKHIEDNLDKYKNKNATKKNQTL